MRKSAAWPEVAVDDDGDAAVVWVQDWYIAGTRVSAAGIAGPPQIITPRTSGSPSVTVNRSGSALVTWSERMGSTHVAKARRFGVDGTLGLELTLGPGGADGPIAAFADDGTALVVRTEDCERIVSARIGPDDAVSAHTQIAAPVADVATAR